MKGSLKLKRSEEKSREKEEEAHQSKRVWIAIGSPERGILC